MKFQTAKDMLKKLAKGKYHTVQYELSEDQTGELETKCWLYIGDTYSSKSGRGTSFQTCFNELEKKLEEIPDIEA